MLDGNTVSIKIDGRYEGTVFNYVFGGKVTGDKMEGIAELGWEYGQAPWKARRIA